MPITIILCGEKENVLYKKAEIKKQLRKNPKLFFYIYFSAAFNASTRSVPITIILCGEKENVLYKKAEIKKQLRKNPKLFFYIYFSAAFNASTRSVFSQFTPSSSRPI